MKYKALNYLFPNTHWRLNRDVISQKKAVNLGFIPISLGCIELEYWILHNMMQDCKRNKQEYAFVESVSPPDTVELWRGPTKY